MQLEYNNAFEEKLERCSTWVIWRLWAFASRYIVVTGFNDHVEDDQVFQVTFSTNSERPPYRTRFYDDKEEAKRVALDWMMEERNRNDRSR